jgi:hypothetical protein
MSGMIALQLSAEHFELHRKQGVEAKAIIEPESRKEAKSQHKLIIRDTPKDLDPNGFPALRAAGHGTLLRSRVTCKLQATYAV